MCEILYSVHLVLYTFNVYRSNRNVILTEIGEKRAVSEHRCGPHTRAKVVITIIITREKKAREFRRRSLCGAKRDCGGEKNGSKIDLCADETSENQIDTYRVRYIIRYCTYLYTHTHKSRNY